MGCGASVDAPPQPTRPGHVPVPESPPKKQAAADSDQENKAATKLQAIQRGNKVRAAKADPEAIDMVKKWGTTIFEQADTDKNGKLSTGELTRFLKALPPGPQQQSIDDMVADMDSNADGELSLMEWLANLAKVPALAFSIDLVVDSSSGTVLNFRSFEQQKAKREKEVEALLAKESRSAEEDKELATYQKQIVSLGKRIDEAAANAAERGEIKSAISKWGTSVFKQADTDKNGTLTNKELSRFLKALPPGPQQQSVDEMVASMDGNGDGVLTLDEWLTNLADCPALAFSLDMVVDGATGEVAGFRSWAQQKEKREGEVAALLAKDSRSAEEDKELAEYQSHIEWLNGKIAEADANEAKAAAA